MTRTNQPMRGKKISTQVNILYWPLNTMVPGSIGESKTYVFSNHQDSKVDECTGGFVIGWKEDRTWIVAGIIPVSSKLQSCDCISQSIKLLRRTFICCSCCHKSTDRHEQLQQQLTGKTPMAMNGNNQNQPYSFCTSCICIQNLTILAAWFYHKDAVVDHPSNGSSCRKSRDPSFHVPSELPMINLSPNPRYPYYTVDFNYQNQETQLILFDTCLFRPNFPRLSLGHYRHLDSSLYNNNCDTYCEHHCCTTQKIQGIRRILMRISEVSNIMFALEEILNDTSTSTDLKVRSSSLSYNAYSSHSQHIHVTKNDSLSPSSLPLFRTCFSSMLGHSFLLHYFFKRPVSLRSHLPIFTLAHELVVSMNSSKGRDTSIFTPREIRSILFHRFDDRLFQKIFDSVMGILIGTLILYHIDSAVTISQRVWMHIHKNMLSNKISWLESNPIGFKLNIPLTHFFGKAILQYLLYWEQLAFRILPSYHNFATHILFPTFGITAIFFGMSVSLALALDVIQLFWLYIYFLYRFFQLLFSGQSSLLSSLTKLFRGKKKNVLRNRVDTLEYDYMQLLVGMILFTICLFLFTTLAMYYFFFTILYLTTVMVASIFWVALVTTTSFPLGHVVSHLISPDRYMESIYFSKVNVVDDFLNDVHFEDTSASWKVQNLVNRIDLKLHGKSGKWSKHIYEPFILDILRALSKVPVVFVHIVSGAPLPSIKCFTDELCTTKS